MNERRDVFVDSAFKHPWSANATGTNIAGIYVVHSIDTKLMHHNAFEPETLHASLTFGLKAC